MKRVLHQFLSKEKIEFCSTYTKLFFILVFFVSGELLAQMPKNLVYANENLKFEELYSIGKYKILYISDFKRQRKRFAYLLNDSNLVVDTMRVEGNDDFLLRSDSTFSVKSLGDYFEITIRNGQFEADLATNIAYPFSQTYLDVFHLVGDYFIGDKYHEEGDCHSYHYLKADELKGLQGQSNGKKIYGINDRTKLVVISEEDYQKASGESYSKLPVKPLFGKEKSCIRRMSSPYYGWSESSRVGNTFTFYERTAGKIFMIDVTGVPKLLAELELPLEEPKNEGWKYLYDHRYKKHYVIKRIETANEEEKSSKKRKRQKTSSKNYSYELYELINQSNQLRLKPLYKLPFDPVMIDNNLIYEIVQESKKGSAIYFHPLDPDYEYQKSTLIYSEN